MRTVLVIEDDLPLCWLLEKILGRSYRVMVFSNSFEAWYWLKEGNAPDLIISDIKMPGMDGLELLENLRLSGLFRGIPVMILSGHEDSSFERKALDLGAIAYIHKPFQPTHLIEIVDGLMREVDELEKSEIL